MGRQLTELVSGVWMSSLVLLYYLSLSFLFGPSREAGQFFFLSFLASYTLFLPKAELQSGRKRCENFSNYTCNSQPFIRIAKRKFGSVAIAYSLYEFWSLNDLDTGNYTVEKLASLLAKIRRENPAYQSEEALLGLMQQTLDAGKSYFRGKDSILGGNIATIKRMKPVNMEQVVEKPQVKEEIVAEVAEKPVSVAPQKESPYEVLNLIVRVPPVHNTYPSYT